MAAEDIGALYNTKIPGYEDAADIQAALKLFHYGSTTYDETNTNPSQLPNPSLARHLQDLRDDITVLEGLAPGSDYLASAPTEPIDGYIWVDANSTGNGAPLYSAAVYTNEAPTTNLIDGIIWVDKDASPQRAYIYNAGSASWILINELLNIIDASGDLIYGNGADSVTRLPIGSVGKVLKVSSSNLPAWEDDTSYSLPLQSGNSGKFLTTDGSVESWGTVTSGGMTLIGTTALTGVSNTIAIPTGYNNIQLVLRDIQGNTSTYLRVAAKPASGSPQHHWIQMRTGFSSVDSNSESWATIMQFDSSSDQSVVVDLYDYDNSVCNKVMSWNAAYGLSGGAIRRAATGTANIETTSPITQFVLTLESGGNMNGTALLYGVK